MPNHRINQRITKSDKFFKMDDKAQILYLLGFAFLDDYGCWTADPHEIWRDVFVDHRTIKERNIPPLLEELADVGLTKLYAVEGKFYQKYTNFDKFQVFGRGYNKHSLYPDIDSLPVDGCNWVYSGVKGVFGSMPTSISNILSSTSTSYKEEEIEGLDLTKEEKEVLKCFISLSYKINKEGLDNWKKWLAELKKDYKDKDLTANAKKWRDYFEQKPPKNLKNSFRNWVAKPYADSKPQVITQYDEANRKFQERYNKTLKK